MAVLLLSWITHGLALCWLGGKAWGRATGSRGHGPQAAEPTAGGPRASQAPGEALGQLQGSGLPCWMWRVGQVHAGKYQRPKTSLQKWF